MDSRINNGMCRCCASEGTFKDLASTYHWMGEEEIYAEMLKECLDIHLSSSEDGEEGGICEVCITQLRNASNFKKQVLHTERQFKKRLQERLFKTSIVKVEVPGPDEDALESDNDNNVSEDFSGTEYEVPIKEEIEEPKPKKRATKATTSRVKKLKSEHGETSTKRRKGRAESKKTPTKKDVYHPGHADNILKKQELLNKFSNLAAILQYSNATIIRSQTAIGFTCFFCDELFSKPAELKSHTIKLHSSITKSNCLKVISLSYRNASLREFMVRIDITGLRCELCLENVDNLEDFFEHLNTDHNKKLHDDPKNSFLPFKFDTEELKCFMCSEMFTTFKKLQEHMNMHYRNFICVSCESGFLTVKQLRNHERTHDNGEFPCTYCSKMFNTDQKRKYHEKSVHSEMEKRMYRCSLCRKTFKYHRDKQRHLVECHGAPEQNTNCQACDRVFRYRKQYQAHYKRHHLLSKPHECKLCDMNFCGAGDLKNHMIKHTREKAFVCDICNKRFTLKKVLITHMRIHSNDRRFVCSFCEQAFVQKCSLKLHLYNKHGVILK